MQSSRPQNAYPCAQPDLYAIIRIGWTSYQQHLPAFSAYASKYDAALGTDQIAAMVAARSMPDEYAREEVHKTLRLQLTDLSETCLKRWMDMSSYIRDGFPPAQYANKRLAAGHAYYAPALGRDWEKVTALMTSGLEFLSAHTAQLTAGGMPAAFPAALAAAATAYDAVYNDYQQALEESLVLTDQRIEANNALYRALMSMFEDGKRIFRHDAAIRLQFTFDHILNTIDNGGNGGGTPPIPADTATVVGTITDAMSLLPLALARVAVMHSAVEHAAFSDDEGKYTLTVPGVAAPTAASLSVSLPPYLPQGRPITLDPDHRQEENFQLMPMAPPAP